MPNIAIGLHASTLVRDGGTLQIGIGALSDALCHALVLRHTRQRRVPAMLQRAVRRASRRIRAVQRERRSWPFELGLYGCSEMINDGLPRAGAPACCGARWSTMSR
jgi:acyl-CoA hydrolase